MIFWTFKNYGLFPAETEERRQKNTRGAVMAARHVVRNSWLIGITWTDSWKQLHWCRSRIETFRAAVWKPDAIRMLAPFWTKAFIKSLSENDAPPINRKPNQISPLQRHFPAECGTNSLGDTGLRLRTDGILLFNQIYKELTDGVQEEVFTI